MGFGKAFGISIALFIGVNFGFAILLSALAGTIGTFFSSMANMTILSSVLFGPIIYSPGITWLSLVGSIITGFTLNTMLLYIGYIVAPLLAALIGGRFGEGKGQSFGCWFLTACISFGVVLVMQIIFGAYTIGFIIEIIIYGVINGFFYGCFALLMSSSDFY